MRIHATTDPHHPQELIDIIATILTHSSIDDQHIIHIQLITHLKRLILRR